MERKRYHFTCYVIVMGCFCTGMLNQLPWGPFLVIHLAPSLMCSSILHSYGFRAHFLCFLVGRDLLHFQQNGKMHIYGQLEQVTISQPSLTSGTKNISGLTYITGVHVRANQQLKHLKSIICIKYVIYMYKYYHIQCIHHTAAKGKEPKLLTNIKRNKIRFTQLCYLASPWRIVGKLRQTWGSFPMYHFTVPISTCLLGSVMKSELVWLFRRDLGIVMSTFYELLFCLWAWA